MAKWRGRLRRGWAEDRKLWSHLECPNWNTPDKPNVQNTHETEVWPDVGLIDNIF